MKEEWKDIQGYEGLYQVSNMGRVKSLNYKKTGKERILKLGKNKYGYYQVIFYKDRKIKNFIVNRLVAQAFLPNPNNYPCVNHKDEDKLNNCVNNLEWVTQKYNANYGTRNERMGKAHKGMKHTQETKEKMIIAHQIPILQFSKSGNIILGKFNSAKQAERELNIARFNICNCCRGKIKSCGGYRWMYYDDYINRMNNYFNLALKEIG